MKTVKKGFSRGLSILLTLLMVLSLTVVGMVSSSAAEVDIADSGWYSGDRFCVETNVVNNWSSTELDFVSTGTGDATGYFTKTFTFKPADYNNYFDFRVNINNGNTYLCSKNSSAVEPTENTEGSLKDQIDQRGNQGNNFKLNCSSFSNQEIDLTIKVIISGGSITDLTYKVVPSGGSSGGDSGETGGGGSTGGGETTTMRTFTDGEYIYIKNFSLGNDNWILADSVAWAYLWLDSDSSNNCKTKFELCEGTAGAVGSYYRAPVTAGTYDKIIFTRNHSNSTGPFDGDWNNKTGNMIIDPTNNCYTGFSIDGVTYTSEMYTPTGGGETGDITISDGKDSHIILDCSDCDVYKNVNPFIYIWQTDTDNKLVGNWPGTQSTKQGELFYVGFNDITEKFSIIVNNGNNGGIKTPDIDIGNIDGVNKYQGKGDYYFKLAKDGKSASYVKYVPYSSGGSGSGTGFYVDMTPNDETFTDDHIKPTVSGNTYTLYLPSGVDRSAVTIKHDYERLTIGGQEITSGQTVALSGDSYQLGGGVTGTLRVYKSQNVSSIHTTTGIPMPQQTYMKNPVTGNQYDNKENYSTSGTIVVFDKDGNQVNTDITLKKIKGRGNSSWEASYKLTGKYAFNITLAAKAKLLDESAAAKKYCLVSYNADEARMRNMVIYELAQQIGLNFSPDYEPIDLYNNGVYVGSYLLTDKVEIGNPLVDIVNLDKENEKVNSAIYAADDISTYRRSSKNNDLSEKTEPGYKKWVNMTEIADSVYANSGFLLEFELNDRFPDEISGFISTKGQQIVVKYPEYTSKGQIDFISKEWNEAEALMYNKDTTYEKLSEKIDVESFARMYLIQEFTKNLDGCATSFYVYYDEGRFHAGPAWDYDWTLGQYAKTYTDRVNGSSVHNSNVNADPSNTDGWYLNSKTIYNNSEKTLNAQAALCQNPAFWSAVKAEWNESFYDAVKAFTTGTASNASGLTGIIAEFYERVRYSTAMDEAKWGIIAADKMVGDWGSKDTGDSHDVTTVYLNNWIYNRLQWMDKYLGRTLSQDKADFYKADYKIQPPKVTADKDKYNLGDPVVLTIDDVTGGAYTYTIYKDGVQLATSQEGPTFTTTADRSGEVNYTVVATSKGVSKYSSAASSPATVTVGGFQAAITDVEIPQSAMVGETVTVKVTSNAAEGDDVTYTLKDSNGNNIAEPNSTGEFTFVVTEAMISETYKVIVGLSVTPTGGETTTASRELSMSISAYTMTLTINAPGSAEVGTDVEIKASANTTQPVTYTLYDSNDTELESNSTGCFTVKVNGTADSKLTYTVKAHLTDNADKSAEKTVEIVVTAKSDTYKVVLYFKSSDSLGYRPQLKTTGATNDSKGAFMARYKYICKNVSQTASYSWYKSEILNVSKAADRLIVNIVSTRYAMEGESILTPSSYSPNADGVIEIYLACDNLNYNSGGILYDLTSWTEEERNWTQNAAHMIYDKNRDSAHTYAAVAAMIAPRYIGDVNNDGVVNVKDATLLQKSIAGTATLDADTRYISDVFYDGIISVKDATAIQKRVVNL